MLFVARSYSFAHGESPACRRISYSCIQEKAYFHGESLLWWRKPTLMAKAYSGGEILLSYREATLISRTYSHIESLLWRNPTQAELGLYGRPTPPYIGGRGRLTCRFLF